MQTDRIRASGITDVGLKREENEDSFSLDDDLGLYVVADGMGGHLAGEVASRIAVDLVNKSFRKWKESETSDLDLYGYTDPSLTDPGNHILSSIRLANRVVFEMATENNEFHGMGTTIVALVVIPELIIAANVGDSRIYLVRNGQIERLSKDHTVVAEQVEMGIMTEEEAQNSPLSHILTRNLGSNKEVRAEVFEIEPAPNDRYILCSDGVSDLILDEEIRKIVECGDGPETLCRSFIDEVLKRGGHDNATVVSVYLPDIEKKKQGIFRKMGGLIADILASIQKVRKNIRP